MKICIYVIFLSCLMLSAYASAATLFTINYDTFTYDATYYYFPDVTGNGHDSVYTRSYFVPYAGATDNPFAQVGNMSAKINPSGNPDTYATVANPGTIDLNNGGVNQFTIECWFKPLALQYSTLVGIHLPSNCSITLGTGSDGTPAAYWCMGNGWKVAAASTPLPLNEWSHLAMVYDGGTLQLYVNGAEAGTYGIYEAVNGSATQVVIGGGGVLGNARGYIDDVRVSNAALTAAQLGYHSSLSTPATLQDTCLVAQYNCDSLDPDNLTLTDISGKGRNLSYQWSDSYPSISPDNPFGMGGNNSISTPGGGLYSPTYYAIGYYSGMDFTYEWFNACTLECWVKPRVLQYSTLASASTSGFSANLGIDNSGYPAAKMHASGQWSGTYGASQLPLNEWTHLAMVYNYESNGTVHLFVNGVDQPLGSDSYAGKGTTDPTCLLVGGGGLFGNLNGSIDDVRFCGLALPAKHLGFYHSFTAETTATPAFSPDGGLIISPRMVNITCATTNATIHYTLDGNDPTESSPVVASGSSVLVTPGQTLQAKAWSSEFPPSSIKSATYILAAISGFNRPQVIPYSDAIVVDGNLSDWADAQWAPLDQPYNGSPYDMDSAQYAAKWGDNGNKLYVAIKVHDTLHFFTDSYTGWDQRDAAEIYIHTAGTGPLQYNADQAAAQQYIVGIQNTNRNAVWSVVGNALSIPADAGFQAVGHEGTGSDAGWLFYEVSLTPYRVFSTGLGGKVISQLHSGDVIGLDATTIGYATSYTGMLAENVMAPKYNDWSTFGQHLIVAGGGISAAKQAADYTAVEFTGIVTAAFGDYFYIESSNRASGIRVVQSNFLQPNEIVTVVGYIQTLDSGEKAVIAVYVNDTYNTETIEPLGTINKAVGGGNMTGQAGVLGGVGLNNIGLYMRTTGKVSNASGTTFNLDDGSGVNLKAVITGSVTLPTNGTNVAVSGIVSCEKVGSDIKPVFLVTSRN